MAPLPGRALTLSDKLLMPPDNQLKWQVSQSFPLSFETSPFDELVKKIDYTIVSVHYEMMEKRDIKEPNLTNEERMDATTKFLYRLKSHELRCEGNDVLSMEAAKFFEKNAPEKWVRQFFQDSPKPDGKTIESSATDETPLIEGPARSDGSSSVRAVDSVDGRTNNGESTKTPVKRNVVQGVLQGPVFDEYDGLAGTLISVDATNGAHIGLSKDNTNKGDVIGSPTGGFGLVGDRPASNGRLVGIECHEGAHHTTEGLENKAASDFQATKSHSHGDWEESALEDKRAKTSETRTLAGAHGNARGIKKLRTGAKTSAPHVSAAGNVDARSESSAATNARVQSKSAEVELRKDRSTYDKKVEIEPISRQLGELSAIDANRSNGMADEDGSVNTDPKQAMSLKHGLAVVIPSEKRATETKQTGGGRREKGHSRHSSVESLIMDPMAVGQMGFVSTRTSPVSDMKLEEGEHPGSHIPFPAGNRSPKFFSWSGDGHLGPYFVAVIEQSHALRVGLVILLGLLIYVACGWLA